MASQRVGPSEFDLAVLDGRDNQARAALIAERIEDWKSIANS